ncbi:MAG: hypothetical protein LBS55_12210 [Prevotellaceae bacterium]|nr:hypothetical protein [Prevotellaceae bacterium]
MSEQSDNSSEEQKKSRKRFQRATIYTKGAIDDPQIREQYDAVAKKKKGLTAYNVAVADFFNAFCPQTGQSKKHHRKQFQQFKNTLIYLYC